jgi:hypothetical protein
MMRPLSRLLSLLLTLSACTSTTPMTLPDGRKGFLVACTEEVLSWEDCFERAGEICRGQPYDVFVRPGKEGALVAAEPQHLHDIPASNRRMVIACR